MGTVKKKGTVGVIGLGIMGGAFARNLIADGWRVIGYDIDPARRRALARAGVAIAASMLTLTFLLAVYLGIRVFKLDRQTSMLIGAGSAICGAAAVIAAEPVVGGQAHKVSVAVATVVLGGIGVSVGLLP